MGTVLHLKRNRDNVYDCTSSNFEGMIAACKPEDSWVCRWQRINKFNKGVYAISVQAKMIQLFFKFTRATTRHLEMPGEHVLETEIKSVGKKFCILMSNTSNK